MTTVSIISTPIGNMLDITLRALVTLRTNFILCENPKITKKLLFHYRINNKPHKLNLANVRIAIKSKHNVCVVSDSGTPLVCDPGYKAVKALCDAKYKLISVPGACAVTCALVCAQMPTNKYLFVGFLPKSKQRAKTQLISYISTGIALIAFESPRRIKTTIKTLIEIAGGDLKISVCIELTKFNEKIVKGRAQDVYNQLYQLVPMGEITLLVWSKTVTHCVRDAIFNKIAKYIKSTPL
ncbi:Ribosomal RNA small subunit methyltransferase I [Candidatus Hodgkinia cicadicola]|nr:Ribosomal RNA small subunit methyltransferase I [Candidatus Hodgkinia cicadicola]